MSKDDIIKSQAKAFGISEDKLKKVRKLEKADPDFIKANAFSAMVRMNGGVITDSLKDNMPDSCKYCKFRDINNNLCTIKKIEVTEKSPSCEKWKFSGFKEEFLKFIP